MEGYTLHEDEYGIPYEVKLGMKSNRIKEDGEHHYPHNVWNWGNLAIPMTYICVGFVISFPSAYIQYYPRTLGASDAQLSTIGIVRALPWTFKVLYGFFADAFPVFGYRFKPYMLLGCCIASGFNLCLAKIGSPDIVAFTMLLLGSMFGIIMVDVMGDALVASKARMEPLAIRGSLQSTVYMCRFCSEVAGYWSGAILSNPDTWGFGFTFSQAFMFLSVTPMFIAVPFIWMLEEDKVDAVKCMKDQLNGLWEMVQMQAVWQPLCFIVMFNALSTYNAAWGNYLQVEFHFNAFQYGSMSAVGSTVALLGVYFYRTYMLHSDKWRTVYVGTSITIFTFSMLNIALVLRINEWYGIPAFWFAMGDQAIQYFSYGIQYMPSAIMFVTVCPDKQEGVSFAMLTGFQNLAGGIAATISNLLLGIWPVQLQDLRAGNTDGIWKLTLLTNMINLTPLLAVGWLLPTGIAHVERLKQHKSKTGGIITIVGYLLGFIWVVTMSLLAIVKPCYSIVGGNGCH